VLEGRNHGVGTIRRALSFEDVTGFRLGGSDEERLEDRPTLVVEWPGGDFLITSAVVHGGVLQEVLHQLSELQLGTPRRATVVLPLRKGTTERARVLAEAGPPFDPAGTALLRHHVLLTGSEAIFVFEAESQGALEALLGQLDLWAAAVAWQEVAAGTPRLAEAVYAWERPLQLRPGLGF
jgi:hypothetical protein